jgi:hypothetical protein
LTGAFFFFFFGFAEVEDVGSKKSINSIPVVAVIEGSRFVTGAAIVAVGSKE